MSKELTIKESIKDLAPITNKIDNIVNECLPIAQAQTQKFSDALVLAKGIKQLRDLFYDDKNIKATVLAMKDSKLGFMTDRTDIAIEKSKGKLKAYSYIEIADCCIEALLKGYRLTDNEFNIIASNFYAAKNGKYRRVIETEGLTDLSFANSTPIFKTETRMTYSGPKKIQFAEVQCYASWKMNGKNMYLGFHPKSKDNKDALIFKIKTNEYMGDDGIVGKALSKLFGRILSRISGKLIEESTDINEPVLIEQEPTAKLLTDKLKQEKPEDKAKNTEPKKSADKLKDVKKDPHSDMAKAPAKEAMKVSTLIQIVKSFEVRGISETEICAYYGVDDLIEMDSDTGIKELTAIVSDIESGNLKPTDFQKQAAERFEMRQKEKS